MIIIINTIIIIMIINTYYDNNNILRDGTINRADVNVLIMNINTGEQVEEITYDGRYSITFTVKDLAGNSVSSTKTLIVDSLAPVITYNKISIYVFNNINYNIWYDLLILLYN